MFGSPATLIGMAGVVFLAGSFTTASLGIASFAKTDDLPAPVQAASATISRAKGDRLNAPLPGPRATISTVELVGVTQATVILRDQNGEVLYRADPQAGITVFAKNTDLPVLTLKEETYAPMVQHPAAPRREGNEAPGEQKPKRRNPVGCFGDVSPLASASADRTPSLCLARLDQSLS